MRYNVPPRNPIFVEHQDVLAHVALRFQSSPLAILHSPGGMGKTAFAIEYCYRLSPSASILWLNASSRLMLSLDASSIARQLTLPDFFHEPSLFAVLKNWLHEHTDWFLVLDDIQDLSLLDLIVPPEPKGQILVTTRLSPFEASSLPSGLSEPTLLLLRQADFLVEQEAPAPIQVLTRRTTGSRLTDALLLFQQRAAAFSQETGDFETFQREEMSMLVRAFSRNLPIILVEVLRVLAFLQPEAIPQEVLFDVVSDVLTKVLPSLFSEPSKIGQEEPSVLEDTLKRLKEEELLSSSEKDETLLHLHPGLEMVLITSLTDDEQHQWASQAIRLFNHVFPQVHFDTWDACHRLFPLARACAILITVYQLSLREGALLLERLGTFCFRQASYTEAETYLTQALALSEKHLSTHPLDAAQVMNSLGRLFSHLARYEEAEALHQRALKIREQELGSDDPKTAESLHNLALIYADLGQYHRAEELLQRVLVLEENSKGEDHLDVASTLNNLALVYYHQGRSSQAEVIYHRTLAIYEHSLPPDHPDWAYPLDGLGALAEQQGDDKQAEEWYRKAHLICLHAFGTDHPETAHSLNKLADIAEVQGNDQEAETLYQQALSIGEETLGPDHPDIALFLNNLAFLAQKQGHDLLAEERYQRALSIYEHALGPIHPDVASVLNNLGRLSRKTGNEDRAEQFLRRSLAISEQVLGATHPDTMQSLLNLGTVLHDQGNDEEAESVVQHALALRVQAPEAADAEIDRVPEQQETLEERGNTENGDTQFL